MLKKLFAAALLLAFTATANATPLVGINGDFSMIVGGDLTLNADGSVSEINFTQLLVGLSVNELIDNGSANDFHGLLAPLTAITITENPLVVADLVADTSLWSVAGFEFFISEIISNKTVNSITGLTIIGTLRHAGFEDTLSQYFISGQNLSVGLNLGETLSASVTSPAPPVAPQPPVEVSAPGTLALFGLALIGFAASRRQKKSI